MRWATSWVFSAVGRPVPMSRYWRMPASAGEVGHGAAEERPVGARHFADAGVHGGDVVADLPVHLVVVLAAEPVVPHAGVVRDVVRGPLPRLLPALLAHVLSLTSVVP